MSLNVIHKINGLGTDYPRTPSILVGQIWKSPDISQSNSIADSREDVFSLVGPVPSFCVLIPIIHMWILLIDKFKNM